MSQNFFGFRNWKVILKCQNICLQSLIFDEVVNKAVSGQQIMY